MQFLESLIHFDQYLVTIIDLFGPFTYVILFGIIFAETGLVVTPFLPGDSLLFVIGTLAGSGLLDIWICYFTLLVAAILGDAVNYWVGYKLGPKVFAKEDSIFFKKSHLDKTRDFYEKYGAKTIVLARLVPIVRTFAPFVAGMGQMNYRAFTFYNVVGALMWVTSILFAGYFFGAIPLVKANLEYAILGIVFVSLLPMIFEYLRQRKK
jgi:membrane-associated protein